MISDKFLSQFNDFLPYGVILISEDLKVLYHNKKAKELLFIKSDIDNEEFFDSFNKFPNLLLFIEDAFSGKKNFSREFNLSEDNIVQVDGIFLDDNQSLNSLDNIKINGALILCVYPVSHFKRSEKNQRQFVANVSHELKTPLTSILGYIETLLDDDNIEIETKNKFLKIIQRQSQRLATIVSDLLTLSQLDKEEVTDTINDLKNSNIVDVIINSIDSMAFKAEAKNINLVFHGHEQILLPFEPGLMEQALINLIDNAIKFTPNDGTVEVKLKLFKKYMEINVIDEGPGIPEKYHTRIFERFFSVDKGRSRKLGGSGLGLSIVKHIVLNHKGEIFINTNLNSNGSTFTIHLPLE
jgi:two-component system, OmpR family, phosphate regulon sensor histidine kinase PhoR